VIGRSTAARVALALCWLPLTACDAIGLAWPLGEDAARGRRLAERYGCVACHQIPGAQVTGLVGPPLRGIAARAYLAGGVPNTAENVITWIRFPDRASPGTLMPNLGVSEPDARDLAAYLYALR
jgi:cytochrome c